MISEKNVDRSHRLEIFNPEKLKSRPVTVKFAPYNVLHKVFANKQKLKGKGISISETLMKLRLVEWENKRTTHLWKCSE